MITICLLFVLFIVMTCTVSFQHTGEIKLKIDAHTNSAKSNTVEALVRISGGKKKTKFTKSKKDKGKGPVVKNAVKGLHEQLQTIKPATRYYLLLAAFCTIVHLVGLPAQVLFSINAAKFYEVWRYFTSVAYFGAPSLSLANSLYFLIRYGQQLETLNGTGEHAWFMLTQVAILSLLGMLFGFPFLAQAMISATLYVSCRLDPFQLAPVQFGLTVPAWQLPYFSMGVDILAQQSAAAAWPHVLGILSGHVYHFFTTVWPLLGGTNILQAPKWFIDRFGGKPKSNFESVNLSANKIRGKASKNRSQSSTKKFGTIFNS